MAIVAIVVIVVGIVVALAVMTMGTVGLQGAHHIEVEVVVIILPGAHLMVEGQGGTDLGHFHTLLMTAPKGGMHVALGKACLLG